MDPRLRALLIGSQLAFRAAVASSVAYVIAKWLDAPFPIFAVIAAIIVMDMSPAQTRSLGLQRLAATAIGAICGLTIWVVFGPAEWVVGPGILAAMALSHLLNLSAGAKVSGVTCALLILNFSDSPWTFAWYRFVETVLGISVAWLVSLVPRLFNLEEVLSVAPDRRD